MFVESDGHVPTKTRLIESIFEGFDEYESLVNGTRTAAGMKQAARAGYFPGARPPFGYRVEKIDVGPVRRSKLVPNEQEIGTHNLVFSIYIEGAGAKSAAAAMNARGYTMRNGKPWTKAAILRVIEETAAIGQYR